MSQLDPILCPSCNRSIVSEKFTPDERGGATSAASYASCLRRCADCRIGFSNARDPKTVVRIHRDLRMNIPEPVRASVLEILASAINIRNRENKCTKFAFESSEDAATWTVFRHLQMTSSIAPVLRACGLDAPCEPSLLLWGVPIGVGDSSAHALRDQLLSLLGRLGEKPDRLSEPDVILEFGEAGLIIIEVKYRSPNDKKDAGYKGWGTYIDHTNAFIDASEVRRSGQYELTRNWRIGWELAGIRRPFTLVNLGPAYLFADAEGMRLDDFSRTLRRSDDRRFERTSWDRFLAAIPFPPDWFAAYTAARHLHDPDPRA